MSSLFVQVPRTPYPKPGRMGGRLIRECVKFIRSQGLTLPLTSDILIAISGGSDSVALAHLLIHFGRKIVAKEKITLLHVNHGWRGAESDEDQLFVEDLGRKWNVPVRSVRLKEKFVQGELKESWESVARQKRKAIFNREARKREGWVFTAHHADDLAETLIWRLFTGAVGTHGAGILFQYGVELRPFLRVRKEELRTYLNEVGETYRTDSTNLGERFLRAKMRARLMPEIEKIFPRAVKYLVDLGLEAAGRGPILKSGNQDASEVPFEVLFQAAGVRPRRSQLDFIQEKWITEKGNTGEVHLSGGWKLRRNSGGALNLTQSDRWILERIG